MLYSFVGTAVKKIEKTFYVILEFHFLATSL